MKLSELRASGEPRASTTNNAINQFVLLAKNAQDSAILEIVRQVLEAPGIYIFGDLLDIPKIQELKNGTEAKYYRTLHLFAYGTYNQYKLESNKYIELTPPMLKKLQHLTIVSLAIENKSISYDLLMKELDIVNIRSLEDVIIEAFYADIIHGKLFQNKRILEISYVQGRDIPPGYIDNIERTLADWLESCDDTLQCIEEQIESANLEKSKRLKNKENIEQEINNVKKTLKNQMDTDETSPVDLRESTTSTTPDLRKKGSRPKPRPSGTFKLGK